MSVFHDKLRAAARKILKDARAEHRTIQEAADSLGISRTYYHDIMRRAKVEKRKFYVMGGVREVRRGPQTYWGGR